MDLNNRDCTIVMKAFMHVLFHVNREFILYNNYQILRTANQAGKSIKYYAPVSV